jgi:hypothetical protein
MLPFRQSYSRVFHKNQENLQVSRVVKGPGHMLCYKGQLCLYPVPCISVETNAQAGVCHGARFTVQRVVQCPQGCDTYIKYNDEPSKTGVSKLPLWGLGVQACNTSPPGRGSILHLKLVEIKSKSRRGGGDG